MRIYFRKKLVRKLEKAVASSKKRNRAGNRRDTDSTDLEATI